MDELLTLPSQAEDVAYFNEVVGNVGSKIQVKWHEDKRKGRALFAKDKIIEGEVILKEEPLISMQDTENQKVVLLCSHCLRHAGKLEDQIYWYLLNHSSGHLEEEKLKKKFEHGDISLPRFDPLDEGNVVYCRCGNVYCSEECKSNAFLSYHQFLCKDQSLPQPNGIVGDAEALSMFEDFCEETNPSLYLVAKALCQILSRLLLMSKTLPFSLSAEDLAKAWKPYWHAWRPLWWECMELPQNIESEEDFRSTLEELMHRASALFSSALRGPSPFQSLVNPQVFGSLMGMTEQNNITIKNWSPLEEYIDQLNEAEETTVQELWTQFPALKEAILEAARYSAEGSGYYPIACCANHSCCPNAKSARGADVPNNHTLVLVACKTIQAGEEITISYIDEEESFEERTLALRDYGFQCECCKCQERE